MWSGGGGGGRYSVIESAYVPKGGRNIKAYRCVEGGELKNKGFTVYVVDGWPLTVNLYADFSLENLIICIRLINGWWKFDSGK